MTDFMPSKTSETNPNARIVIVTGDINAGESDLLDSLKVTRIIYKPFDMHMIKQVLADVFLS